MVGKQIWLWIPGASFVSPFAGAIGLVYVIALGRQLPILDFAVYHNASIAFAHGTPLYDVQSYIYSPFFAWMIQPLGWLPVGTSRTIWYMLQVIALMGLMWISIVASGSDLARRYWGVVWLGMVLMLPTRADFLLGQTGILLALLMVGSFAARRHPWIAGTLLALAALIKVYPAVLWLFYVTRRPRGAMRMAAAAVGVVAVSVLVCGLTLYVEWFAALVGGEPYPTMAEHNDSLTGFWLRMFTLNPYVQPIADMPVVAYTLLTLSSLLVIGGCLWLERHADHAREPLHYSAWLCAMSLLAPANGIYNLVFLLFSCLVIARVLEQQPSSTTRSVLLLVTMPCYMPLTSWLIKAVVPHASMWHIPWLAPVFTPPLYALVGYFVLLVIMGSNRRTLVIR